MSFMFEVYYKSPADARREETITDRVAHRGGKLSYRENPPEPEGGPVCLTYEFDELDPALAAAAALRQQGEHVEGPVDYGP
jgi:hypothetical protein